jgi:hypothetical protein
MLDAEKTNCEYFRIENGVDADGHNSSRPMCTYSEEYHQKTNCEGNREKCAYPEKWEK